MRFSIGDAWTDTMRMIMDRPLAVGGTAALFLVLQYLPLFAIFGFSFALFDPNVPPEDNPILNAATGGVGLILGMIVAYILVFLISILGQMVLMVILHNRQGATFGTAFGAAMRAMPGMLLLMLCAIVAYFIFAVILGMVIGVAIGLGTAASEGLGIGVGIILGVITFLALLYLFTRISLTMPSMVLAEMRNPFTAIGNSWRLTGRCPWKVLLHYLILTVIVLGAYFVLFAGIGGTTNALASPDGTDGAVTAAMIGFIVIWVLVQVIASVITVSAVAAAYRQLSDDEDASLAETFG